jgi:hypothetical protein
MERISSSAFPTGIVFVALMALAVIALLIFSHVRAEAKGAAIEAPFEFGFKGKPGKGDTSFSDAVWRIEVRLYNRTTKNQVIRRNEHKVDDRAFNLASSLTLFDSNGKSLSAIDHRPETDRAMPETTVQDLQVIEPNQNAFLTSLVIRRPNLKSSFTIHVGGQSFENLKAGQYRLRFSWWTNHFGFDVVKAEAKRLKLPLPWAGELISNDFKFEIKEKSQGSYEVDCEG